MHRLNIYNHVLFFSTISINKDGKFFTYPFTQENHLLREMCSHVDIVDTINKVNVIMVSINTNLGQHVHISRNVLLPRTSLQPTVKRIKGVQPKTEKKTDDPRKARKKTDKQRGET